MTLNSARNGASASATALAIATGGAIAPPSPRPLTPSGLSGDGECWCASLVETNYAWGMHLGMFTPFGIGKRFTTEDTEGREEQSCSEQV